MRCFKIESTKTLHRFYRLRFQVYCRERRFIRERDYPDQIESDVYDGFSVHFCVSDKGGNLVAGVRLILPECGEFPIEKACAGFDLRRHGIRREECAEISRLVISKSGRRTAESVTLRQVSPLVIALCRRMYEECNRRRIRYCVAMMSDSLRALLRSFGFDFVRVGGSFNYFGKVAPYVIDLKRIEGKGLFAASRKFGAMLSRMGRG